MCLNVQHTPSWFQSHSNIHVMSHESWAEEGDGMHAVIVIPCSLTELGVTVSTWNVRQCE